MRLSRITELSERVEKLANEFVLAKKDNARLKRLLTVAESKIRKLVEPDSVPTNGGLPELVKQLERLKEERKMIKEKVEKMSAKLEKFYET